MKKNYLMMHISRSLRWSTLLRGQACFSTCSRMSGESDLWGKMSMDQELRSNVTQTKASKITLDTERNEAEKKIQQLQNIIRESEHKLTGLQRMKYKKDDYEKENYVLTKLRTMRNQTTTDPNLRYGASAAGSQSQSNTTWSYRMVKAGGDAITCTAFAVICYGLYKFFNKKIDEHEEKQALKLSTAAGSVPDTGLDTNQSSLVSSTAAIVSSSETVESSESIFD